MSEKPVKCRSCGGTKIVKDGLVPRWKAGQKLYWQYYQCGACGRHMQGEFIPNYVPKLSCYMPRLEE